MQLSDDQIGALLDWFVAWEKAKPWTERRAAAHKEWKAWLHPRKIGSMPDDKLRELFLDYFNRGAGRHGFNPIYRDRIVRDKGRFRETLGFLLDESVPVQQRLDSVVDRAGAHHIDGMGKGLATSLLMDLDATRHVTWNNKTNMGLAALGIEPHFDRGASYGERYMRVLDTLTHIRSQRAGLTFLDVDLFMHVVSAEQEGKAAVEAVAAGQQPPSGPMAGDTTPDTSPMGFPMEKYLEDFIEANFSKIDFGAKLELYQDDDGSGRQYRTPAGNIDLLAVDSGRRNLVVIELKKGATGASAVGQVLGYMGWVSGNLTVGDYADYDVRGIVIAREKDESLEQALKMVPNVELFLYSVSFALERSG